ncbi:cytochrome c oxidase accessory protein CcoG [Methylophaga sp. 41_12_T18]|nr:cytochrome c oxidase accessory protein CcoG [Methylophaga sp. 41_12_T18]
MTKLVEIPVKVEIYDSLSDWNVETGEGEHITARRLKGRFRNIKNMTMSVWLIYFLGPYLRWNGEQAILLDIPKQQFHLFSITLFPQDIWVLSLALLFLAIMLAAATGVAGRVFCGYFCFQTVWTDAFSYIEGKLEGNTPQKAHKFKAAPWSSNKLVRKLSKHSLWLLISVLTGISFAAWFVDAFKLWQQIITLTAAKPVWIAVGTFTFFTYWFAGFMREQVCFWLCPYARLQGVMYDQDTVLPAYDAERGEPRTKYSKQSSSDDGSCIDCNLCVAVCPTGIDIRKGQQEGCITCGLCIDACDSIMDKIKQPKGLIRYSSYKELHKGEAALSLVKRPRVIVYSLILLLSVAGIIYGFTHFSPTEFKVVHERQPLFVKMSDGSIQNKYTLKLLNKTKQTLLIKYEISGLTNATVSGIDRIFEIEPGKIIPITALVRQVPSGNDKSALEYFNFIASAVNNDAIKAEYNTVFISQ